MDRTLTLIANGAGLFSREPIQEELSHRIKTHIELKYYKTQTAGMMDVTSQKDANVVIYHTVEHSRIRTVFWMVDETNNDRPLVKTLREVRKNLFVVALSVTQNCTDDQMYLNGLYLLKGNHVNLCLVYDSVRGRYMVVTPEESRYHETYDINEALCGLVEMASLRSRCTFTKSTVVDHPGVPWDSSEIPSNLRDVVNHCIERGAYRPHNGRRGPVTAGHFAVRGKNGRIITSRRWSNFNDLSTIGMIEIETIGDHEVIAYGGKPSVGGQSQRIVFTEHPELESIVHFHCPLKANHTDDIPHVDQRPNECGSHECGQATSSGLRPMHDGIHAVMLDNHGPNIVYGRDVPAQLVIDFIERNFDLDAKTGGFVS